MPRPVLLFSGQWADVALAELAQQAAEWGYQGLELCCWGDHFEVQRALSESDYCQEKLDLLSRHDLADFAHKYAPIRDACRDQGVKFAFEVHPGQIAFDLYSTEMVLDALHGREEFGLLFDASHLHWQGIDPVEFVRRFPDRIYHVHV